MRYDVIQDWQWSDGFLPEVRRILFANALHLFDVEIATEEQDLKQATDMVIRIQGEKTIAVRLRRSQYAYRDLTIRAWREGNIETELHKIKAGFGDLYLYGWTQDMKIAEWILVDLTKVRAFRLLDGCSIRYNRDGRTGFIAIPYWQLKARKCLLAGIINGKVVI